MIPLIDIIKNTAVVPVEVVFGKNLFSIGTRFEDLGMTLRHLTDISSDKLESIQSSKEHSSEERLGSLSGLSPQPSDMKHVVNRLNPNSIFEKGQIFATERVFEVTCAETFVKVFKDILA